MESLARKRERAAKIATKLIALYPGAHCTLDHKNAFELLAATILAAQCTDERVNMVTPALFKRYKNAAAMAKADPAALEKLIQSTGFYRNKTKSLLGMAAMVVDRFGGRVPEDMEDLTALPGVGRKTANVIRGSCFGKPAVVVDTHMKRLSNRLGLTTNDNPDKIEADLVKLIDEEVQTMFSHTIVFHGRNVCIARKPKCPDCGINDLCPYRDKTGA